MNTGQTFCGYWLEDNCAFWSNDLTSILVLGDFQGLALINGTQLITSLGVEGKAAPLTTLSADLTELVS